MADTFTSNLNLTKPAVGSSSNTWGGKLNANLDAVDAKFAGTTGSVVLRNANSQSIIAGVRPDDASGTDQARTAVNITSGCGTGTGAGGQIEFTDGASRRIIRVSRKRASDPNEHCL